MKANDTNADDPEMVALGVLAWVLQDDRRAERLLSMTGLTPGGLRAGVGDRTILGAVMEFLMGYEPNLIDCAAFMDMEPDSLARAARRLALP